jgi:hypothetical protein
MWRARESRKLCRCHYRNLAVDWGDNIKVDLKEVMCEGVVWVHPIHNRYQWWALVKIKLKEDGYLLGYCAV